MIKKSFALSLILVLAISSIALANIYAPIVVPEVEFPEQGVQVITLTTENATKITEAKAAGQTAVRVNLGAPPAAAPEQAPETRVTLPVEVLTAAQDMEVVLEAPAGSLSLPAALVNALAASATPVQITVQRPVAPPAVLSGTNRVEGAPSLQVIAPAIKQPTKVTMQVEVALSTDPVVRQAQLDRFLTIANHSSGKVEYLYDLEFNIVGNTLRGVSFWVSEFSTFTLAEVSNESIIVNVGVAGYEIAGIKKDMVATYYKDGNTMMPIRMLEDFGVNLAWNEETKTATMTYRKKTVNILIGSTDAFIDGVRTPIIGANGNLMAAELAPGRTMVPLRFVSENLGFEVVWADADTVTVTPK